MSTYFTSEVKIRDILREFQNQKAIFDFYIIDAKSLIISPKVRLKCMFGCDAYGRDKKCPPNDTLSPEQCQKYLSEYSHAIIIRFEPEHHLLPKNAQINLLELEKRIFFLDFPFALAVFPKHCSMCNDCNVDHPCRNPRQSRPSVSSLCIDILGTLKKLNIDQPILSSKEAQTTWYYIGLIFFG